MRALYYPEYGSLTLADLLEPEPAPDGVLLQVAAAGICGSELETYRAHSPRRKPPLVMGHEFCGTVVSVGANVSGDLLHRRFVSNSVVSCGECVRCQRGNTHLCAQRQIFGMHRGGAFAQYCAVPVKCLIPWPEALPAASACLAEPLANGVHMVNLTRHLGPKTVLVIGAGPIGLMAQQAFQTMLGAEVSVAVRSPMRINAARSLGAKRAFDPRKEDPAAVGREMTSGEGFDMVIDAVGSDITKSQSIEALRPGGAAVWIGLGDEKISFSSYAVTLQERQIFGTYAATMGELQTAVDLMNAGKVDTSSWVSVFPMSDAVDAFERMLDTKGTDIKAVILPND